jgi:hypothetical protein
MIPEAFNSLYEKLNSNSSLKAHTLGFNTHCTIITSSAGAKSFDGKIVVYDKTGKDVAVIKYFIDKYDVKFHPDVSKTLRKLLTNIVG